ncbi:ABC transporter ATP-binding protein [Bacillus wiedmannii]|uniref:ABC transporter ATP-binding protein n=1 Tax=Bacillus wiedmannii TaxID=1890302 RepID=UPI000BEF4FBC|nr:ABC transporter ATP-binding protein [Bacillus wiedmannii]PEL52432.1 hypothetical protein CN622_29685 [Bacillus wiedmannii]PEO06291.1 hypothetical protein CN562_29205 [Bacillus wiedmannii]PEQ00756.1 hypothetical protein CN587_27845 [Bacillus wiedmannii]
MNTQKIIWTYFKLIKSRTLLAVCIMIISTLASILLVYIEKYIIDEIFVAQNYQLLFPTMVIFIMGILVFVITNTISELMLHRNMCKIDEELTEDLFRKYFKTSMGVLQNQRTAKLTNYITTDVRQMSKLLAYNIPSGLKPVISSIILIILVGYANINILMIILFLAVGYFLIGYYYSGKIKRYAIEIAEKRDCYLVSIEEGISSTKEVIAYNRKAWESSKLERLFNEYFIKIIEQVKVLNREFLWREKLRWGIIVLVLGYGGYQVIENELSLGMLVVVYQFSTQLLDAVNGTCSFFINISSDMASVERIKVVLQYEEMPEGMNKIKGSVKSIQFEKVEFKYSSKEDMILKKVDLDFPIGKKIAFVGSSGSGKTTITYLLKRLFEPNAGRIFVNGLPLSDLDREEWTQRINIVTQDSYFFPDTVLNNILLGRENIKFEEVINTCKMVKIHDFILSLPEGYNTLIGDRGITLSGGQKQRLALARAIINNPEILILDEATSALDMEMERAIQYEVDLIRKNRTTIVVAHRLSTIKNADIIYVFDQGKIVGVGSHAMLREKNLFYNSLYTSVSTS